MNQYLKKAAVFALTGAMVLSMSVTAFATDNGGGDSGSTNPTQPVVDPNSQFSTTINNIKNDGTDGVDWFNLIKDYDSINNTKLDTNSIKGSPFSSSPQEAFEYTITPYQVWNAGYTYTEGQNGTPTPGTAVEITKDNMPLLKVDAIQGKYTVSTTDRVMKITHIVPIDAALNEDEDVYANDLNKVLIKLDNYNTVGDYWFEVKETNNHSTGVLYGTNSVSTSTDKQINTTDLNGNHNLTYYIHIQVTETKINEATGNPDLKRNVTLHQTAPDVNLTNAQYNADEVSKNNHYLTGNKVNAIENQYYAGDLVINKKVTGNGGDKDRYFPVTVVFTKPAGTVVNSDIPFTAVLKATNSEIYTSTDCTIWGQYKTGDSSGAGDYRWKATSTSGGTSGTNDAEKEMSVEVVLYVKDSTKVTFSNIPYGITYKIQEQLPADDTYEQSCNLNKATSGDDSADDPTAFNGNANLTADESKCPTATKYNTNEANRLMAVGSITDAHDEYTITNHKDVPIDVGVITENAPFIAMLVVSCAAVVIYAGRRKFMIEE